jgi:hypothetical protein
MERRAAIADNRRDQAMMPNQPAAPNAGIASQLTIKHFCPGVGEPERWPN